MASYWVLQAQKSFKHRRPGKLESLTPLTMRVPTRVTKPLTVSDRWVDKASVVPGSCGVSRARHSSRPLFKEGKASCSAWRSHSSSAALRHQPAKDGVGRRSERYQGIFLFLDQLPMRNGRPYLSGHDRPICSMVIAVDLYLIVIWVTKAVQSSASALHIAKKV